MTILCRVCTEFHYPDGRLIHKVDTRNVLVPHPAPDDLPIDPIFGWMEADGSLSAVYTNEEKKKLENMDPTAGVDASGKRILPEPAETEPAAEPTGTAAAEAASASAKPETKSVSRSTKKTGGA